MNLQHLISKLRPPTSKKKTGSIGMEFSRLRLHMVQFRRLRSGEVSLLSQASISYPCSRDELFESPKLLKQVVDRGFASGRFDGRSAVLGMPGGHFRTIPVNYRPNANQSDDEIIHKLMVERLDGAASDYVMDYIPVRAEARDAEKLAIVAVSKRQDVTRFLDAMRQANLDITALEISPVAIRRLCSALPVANSEMILIVNTGLTRSYLTMLSGRRLLMDQAVEFSEQKLLDALARTLDISEQSAWKMVQRTGLDPSGLNTVTDHRKGETGVYNTLLEILKPEFHKLVEETDRAFMYASAQARGGGDAKILLFGSLCRWRGADRVLSGMTHLPVTMLPNPLQSFGSAGHDDQLKAVSEPEYAVAAGLALRGLLDDE